MATIELGGGRQATYEVIGQGAPTLMFAGGPGFAARYMRATAELFADVLQSHLIDPHGSGGSTPPADPTDYSPQGHAQFYEEVRVALGLPSITVFGHSFGGTTALTYAARYPDVVTRCIAVAALGVGSELDDADAEGAGAEMEAMAERHRDAPWYPEAKDVWDHWTERVLATDDPHEVERMMTTVLPLYTAHPGRPEVAAALADFSTDLKADLAAIKAWESGLFQGVDLRPILGHARMPTLVIAGELDLICGPAQARPIAAASPNATLVLIPDCGHMQTAEAPDLFRETVTAWLGAH
jgi:proline iminopeptidase